MLVLLPALVHSFYLPGVAPRDYKKGEPVPVLVNALTAKDSLLPYDYYHPGFSFCTPDKEISQHESLGSILFGDRLYNSPIELPALENQTCKVICRKSIQDTSVDFLMKRIDEEYLVNWVVDGLPAAQLYKDESTSEVFYYPGMPLGLVEGEQTLLHNHYVIHVHYHKKDADKIRVVGVIVNPASLDNPKDAEPKCDIAGSSPVILKTSTQTEVTYTYTLVWNEDPISWGTRWDHYLHVYDPQIHWFSIVNAIVIILILASMVTMILLRALHKDISRYNTLGDEDGAQDDFGWKMVHADVFRAPAYRMILCVLLGTGAQLICMLGVTLAFAVLGFLSPSSRGSLGTMALVFYILFSVVSGYVSSVMYKTYGGENRKQNVLLTAVLVPGIVFGILIALNFILIAKESSSAVPFGTFLALIGLWFLVSIPLCIAGSYFGFRHPGFEPPCKTNQIPRQIPPQPWYFTLVFSALIGGILPFGAIFIELFFIMTSIWNHRLYYMFGFLFFVFVILIVTCCLVSVLLTYFILCAEDYLWVWKSFNASAASGFYMFVYSIVFLAGKLDLKDAASVVIYLTWSLVMSIMLAIFTGTVGHLASLYFVRTIYKSIKID